TDWQFTREDLGRTPSVGSGWTVEREELDRAKACTLIYSAARKLKLPQVTSATACVFLHRFFMRHSLRDYHHYNIAATCLFFACKSEETLRKLDDFIPIIVHYASKGLRTAAPGTAEFDKWRAVILRTEISLLQALCFDMVVGHPHVQLAALAEELRLGRRVSQMAWSFIGDCLRLPVCVVHAPRAIACAAVSLANRVNAVADDAWLD
ncbi:cyclin-like protein, partial [Linderina pennispora]